MPARQETHLLVVDDEPFVRNALQLYLEDAERRGYPCRWVTYERALAAPRAVVTDVLEWVGWSVDVEAAIDVIQPRASRTPDAPEDFPAHWVAAFDELYGRLHEGRSIDPSFAAQMVTVTGEVRQRARQTVP